MFTQSQANTSVSAHRFRGRVAYRAGVLWRACIVVGMGGGQFGQLLDYIQRVSHFGIG
ncbi:hypothetical protein HZS38_09315 [Xenorhabdus nematophila]|uniref:hypothetical protein n=1 Tax=Xenorhabdus nematophila TaxID=628 RepID=UPI00039A48BC|nr:hypothetical protein [Xenorhabdus nematophila]CEE95786.1 hypothetical protein XNA1_680002 [Xenorhabdus nematophila str. Anatoliense]CEF32172.1 hypothetical protein XNW1_4260002 [Xenorhabdus nematophila str. Websteri]MBA0019321.1 hypothetical protein [Xenorhabdus nematophila]QNJ38221.1 hypothetical protein H8F46_09075 [Xenorhabdus nematophila]CEF33796.1 hypothetical protein XNW1_520002 [Xenorhabdus nematophila str. Websteri]